MNLYRVELAGIEGGNHVHPVALLDRPSDRVPTINRNTDGAHPHLDTVGKALLLRRAQLALKYLLPLGHGYGRHHTLELRFATESSRSDGTDDHRLALYQIVGDDLLAGSTRREVGSGHQHHLSRLGYSLLIPQRGYVPDHKSCSGEGQYHSRDYSDGPASHANSLPLLPCPGLPQIYISDEAANPCTGRGGVWVPILSGLRSRCRPRSAC